MSRRRHTSSPVDAPSRPTRSRQILWAVVLLVALVAFTYWPVHRFDFAAYDDYEFVVENVHVARGLTVDNIRWAFANGYQATGGPLTWLSHMADVEWFGMNPGAHHVINVTIHGCGTLAVFWALWLLTGSVWRGTAVAALFAVHPLHVESVAWIAERKDVLSGLFWFLTIGLYVKYVRKPDWRRYLGVLVVFSLGALSKPMVVTLPFVLLLLDVWPLDRWQLTRRWTWPAPAILTEKLPLLLVGCTALALTFVAQDARGAVSTADALPIDIRVANAVLSYGKYLAATIWPVGLVPYYPFKLDLSWMRLAAAAGALVTISTFAFRMRRTLPALTLGWLWYLGTLVPVIGLVQVGGHAMADRFTYLPLAGIFIAIVWSGERLASVWRLPSRACAAVTAVVILTCAMVARTQVMHWRDGETLWQHAIAVDPTNARARSNLGWFLAKTGRPDEAIREFREALRLHSDVPQTHSNLGLLLEDSGRVEDAITHFREAVRLDPDYVTPRAHLANLLAQGGYTAEALSHFRYVLDRRPDDVLTRVNLAVTLGRDGRRIEGLDHLRQVIARDPSNAQWRYIAAMMLIELGRIDEAHAGLTEALRVDPSHADSRRALNAMRRGPVR